MAAAERTVDSSYCLLMRCVLLVMGMTIEKLIRRHCFSLLLSFSSNIELDDNVPHDRESNKWLRVVRDCAAQRRSSS